MVPRLFFVLVSGIMFEALNLSSFGQDAPSSKLSIEPYFLISLYHLWLLYLDSNDPNWQNWLQLDP